MLVSMEYDRERALTYARRWAFDRNPLFENYAGIGGDCTNFVSQAIYAGVCVMNFTPTFGWYYISPTNRAPAWSGVEFFYNFLVTNEGVSIYGRETGEGDLEVGDVIQLANESGDYYHTLLVSGFDESGYLVAAHSNDALDRPLATYNYADARFLHVEGARIEIPDRYRPVCFRGLLEGESIGGMMR